MSESRPPASALEDAARRFGTPCYLTDLAALERRSELLGRAFPEPWIRQYSLKANPLPAVVARLAESGMGANVVSAGEWEAATAAGLGNRRITLEGIGKTESDLRAAVRASAAGEPLLWVTLESTEETEALEAIAVESGLDPARRPLEVLLRLNPAVRPETSHGLGVGAGASKFGMEAAEIRRLAGAGLGPGSRLRLRGIHVHVGSQLAGTRAWVESALAATRLAGELAALDPGVDTVDLGGGFPAGELADPTPEQFRRRLEAELAAAGIGLPARATIEPGRYLVAPVVWLLARVLHSRERGGGAQVVIDASFAELVRPVLYGARHRIWALGADPTPEARELRPTAVEGALCESTDSFGVHELPPLRRDSLVLIENAGAYAGSMFSHYNGRPRPPEVLLHPDGSLSLARPSDPYRP